MPLQNKKLKPFAQELRINATRQERRLWYEYLRNYPLQFKRQKIIMNYIADFYCAKAKLVIELDGSQHYSEEGFKRDRTRDEMLSSLNFQILRFSNLDIDQNFEGVCEEINHVVLCRTKG